MNKINKKKRRKLLKEKSYLEFRISILSPKRKKFGGETIVPVENCLKIEEYHERIREIEKELEVLVDVKNENNN